MAAPNDSHLFTRERMLTLLLAFATFLGLYCCYLLVKPFIPPVAFALALCVATHRPYLWLRERVGTDTKAATIAVILVTLLIVGPVASLGFYVVSQIASSFPTGENAQSLESIEANIMQYLPAPIRDMLSRGGIHLDLSEQLRSLAGTVGSQAGAVVRGSMNLLTDLVIMLFLLFFLYRDQKVARSSVAKLLPLAPEESQSLFKRISNTIQATVNGSLTVAAVQAVLAGVMYLILGVPAAIVWGAATFFAALVPVFGTFLVWGPITVYLLLVGQFTQAAINVGWAVLAVGTIDNVLYPYLVGDKLRMHTVLTFVAVLGGLSVFGPSGLILGPLALAVTTALLEVWWERTKYGQAAEEAVAPIAITESPAQVIQKTEDDAEHTKYPATVGPPAE